MPNRGKTKFLNSAFKIFQQHYLLKRIPRCSLLQPNWSIYCSLKYALYVPITTHLSTIPSNKDTLLLSLSSLNPTWPAAEIFLNLLGYNEYFLF